jgi:hypothetical protein
MTMIDGIQRDEIHRRVLDLRFYRRSDGLYEVEGSLLDTKAHPFRRQLAQQDTPPGAPLHDITLRLVIDETLHVRDAVATMQVTPFGVCREAATTVLQLKGLHIGRGWNRKVRELLGGAASCNHLAELLGPMATTVLQGLAPQRQARINEPEQHQARMAKVDSCYAYAAEREVVARLWPELHRPKATAQDSQ